MNPSNAPAHREAVELALAIRDTGLAPSDASPELAPLLLRARGGDDAVRAELCARGFSESTVRFLTQLTRPSTRVVRPCPDGDATDLCEAIDAGGTVCVLAGEYAIEDYGPDRPLTLLGEGCDLTVLRAPNSGSAMVCGFPVAVEIAGITFRACDGVGDAFAATQGSIFLHDCRFTGARGRDGRGMGLLARGSSSCRIADSTFDDNETGGVFALDQATLHVEACTTEGGRFGFGFFDRSSGSLRGSTVAGSETGIAVEGQARASIEGNVVTNAGRTGIKIGSDAEATARSNRVNGSGEAGIYVNQHGKASVADNECVKNGRFGIVFLDDATGDATENQCRSNGTSGVLAAGSAVVRFERNLSENNGESGIGFTGESRGVARENRCRANPHGVLSAFSTAPELVENVLEENQSGITYADCAGGTATANTLIGNRESGVVVLSKAALTIERNVCRGSETGISISAGSPTVRENVCEGNAVGVMVLASATPRIERNVCRDNAVAGIAFGGSSGGIATGNMCTGNGKFDILTHGEAHPTIERA